MEETEIRPSDTQQLLKSLDVDAIEAAVNREEISSIDATRSTPYPWILSPAVDLLFCCGGAFWILYAIAHMINWKFDITTNSPAFWLTATAIIGLHIFGDGHGPATFYRVYASKATREKLGRPIAFVGLAALALFGAMFAVPNLATIALKVILAWGFQHQMAQCYGIALIYCYKRNYSMNNTEKLIMKFMVNAMVVFLIVRMFSTPDFNLTNMNGYAIPYWGLLPEWTSALAQVVMQCSVVVFVGMVVRRYLKTKQLLPLPALMNLMTLMLLVVCAKGMFAILWALSANWFHSSQYLVVTSSYYFKEKGLPEQIGFHQISKMLWTWTSFKYFGLLFGVGFCVAYLFPRWMSEHGVNAGFAFTAVYVACNFYHYVTDGFIWKLRDPSVAKLLVS
jgi:hypothetical protein